MRGAAQVGSAEKLSVLEIPYEVVVLPETSYRLGRYNELKLIGDLMIEFLGQRLQD